MFQQGGKFYLNASKWKCYQHLNYSNNNRDKYQDIENSNRTSSRFPCTLKYLHKLKIRRKNREKTGLGKSDSLYSVNSVKESIVNEAGSNTGIDIYRLKQKMANTLSVMTNVLRNVVSKQRIRYKEKGFNLDLAYVCDNIIAMGYPADNYESMYRNPYADVFKFLEDNHYDHYKIYNLCLERSYDITKFHGRVALYPFEDHNPPTIELILNFCEDVDKWLKCHPLNVAAVHCKAGKGRTGTMICCYLLYSGLQRTAEDALACYDEKRTKDRKGVTIPSQRRYVQYFSKLMRLGSPYKRRIIQLCEIRFSKANTLHSQGTVHCSISVLQDKLQQLQSFQIDFRKSNVLDMKKPALPVSGDIKVEVTKNTKKIFHFWFNTFFVTDAAVAEGEGNDVKLVYTLQKWEIDDVHKDKCYPDDFKVELVFYVDDNKVDCGHIQLSTSNRPTTNHRPTTQTAEKIRITAQDQNQHQHQPQKSSYPFPQNNSGGIEVNFICDQKSSSTTSVSSSLGVSGPDISNGYAPNRRTTQRNISVVQNLRNNHSNHYMAATGVNDNVIFSAPTPAPHMTSSNYTEQQQKQPQKNTVSGSDIVGCEEDLQASHDLDENTSTSICNSSNNSTNMISNSYNHSNNSSKTGSVSSQSSSSAIEDNEEDWESGESQAKQLENITFLLSTSTLTNPPPVTTTSHITSTQSSNPSKSTPINFPNIIRNKNLSSDISNLSKPSTLSINSTSVSSSPNCSHNNTCKISNSSCTNRVVGGDDDDDDENIDESKKIINKKSNSNQVVKPAPNTTDTNTKSVEFKREDNSIPSISTCEAVPPLVASAPLSNRPKFMHMLISPKTRQQQSTHKKNFKRKLCNSKAKVSNSYASVCGANDFSGNSLPHASIAAVGTGGGVATASKLKLKIKLKKNKFKLSQKFQWFQSYFRSDPVDFCENFVQQTTSMRCNSMCSTASRAHKSSTSTPPPSITPPAVVNVDSSSEQLRRSVSSVHSVSTSNASIATGDMCEDYYSSICDNQLSFSNSPCKSPRTMTDMASSVSISQGSFGSSFAKNVGTLNVNLRERRATLPAGNSHVNGRRNNGNVVIVAAKPAKTNAIGFNVNATNLACQDSFDTNGEDEDVEESPASIYYTPTCAIVSKCDSEEYTNKAFVFPQTPEVRNVSSDNVDQRSSTTCNASPALATNMFATKPQTKYSLNLVIVKECPESQTFNKTATKPSSTATNNESDGIDSDYCDISHKRILQDDIGSITLLEDLEIDKITARTAATASVCSNSSSSGFCTSECCTTNSSSSSCNCNPFVIDLDKHAATMKQEQPQNTIHEVIETAVANDKTLSEANSKVSLNHDSISPTLPGKPI